jgi:hypothetical protein
VPRLLLATVALATLMLVGCNDEPSADDPNQRLIDIYAAVIPEVATIDHPDLTVDEPVEAVVYVAPRENVSINIEVQLGVVRALEEWADIRFIDEFEEAIDTGEPSQPVRDGSVLVGLGMVSEGTIEVDVVADRYEYVDQYTTFHVNLRRRAGEWTVAEPIEATRIR